jgi:hypothetical protein
MSSELIRLSGSQFLTARERAAVEALLESCARSIERRLPPTLMLSSLAFEFERVAGNGRRESRPRAEQGERR